MTLARSSPVRHRFPAEVISHAVRPCVRRSLGLRRMDERLAICGVTVGGGTVRQRGRNLGQCVANQVPPRLPNPGDKWHLDEVAVGVAGVQHWPWRAAHQDRPVPDILVQGRRNAPVAAKRLPRKPLRPPCRTPSVMATSKLASDGECMRRIMQEVEHRYCNGLNRGAEDLHRPTRRRDRNTRRLKSPQQARRSLPVHAQVGNLLHPCRDHGSGACCGAARSHALQAWGDGIGVAAKGRPPLLSRRSIRLGANLAGQADGTVTTATWRGRGVLQTRPMSQTERPRRTAGFSLVSPFRIPGIGCDSQ